MPIANEDTSPQTPQAKARLSLIQTVRLVDILENLTRRISHLSKQSSFLLIKFDRRDPTTYNKFVSDEDQETRVLLESFRDSLEEDGDRPSQSIIVNVSSKKTSPPSDENKRIANRIVYWVAIVTAMTSGVITALREVGIIK